MPPLSLTPLAAFLCAFCFFWPFFRHSFILIPSFYLSLFLYLCPCRDYLCRRNGLLAPFSRLSFCVFLLLVFLFWARPFSFCDGLGFIFIVSPVLVSFFSLAAPGFFCLSALFFLPFFPMRRWIIFLRVIGFVFSCPHISFPAPMPSLG